MADGKPPFAWTPEQRAKLVPGSSVIVHWYGAGNTVTSVERHLVDAYDSSDGMSHLVSVDRWSSICLPLLSQCDPESVQTAADRADEACEALRSLASYLGNGGYNAPDPIDVAMFEAKIRDGIDDAIRSTVGATSEASNALRRDACQWIAAHGGQHPDAVAILNSLVLGLGKPAPKPSDAGLREMADTIAGLAVNAKSIDDCLNLPVKLMSLANAIRTKALASTPAAMPSVSVNKLRHELGMWQASDADGASLAEVIGRLCDEAEKGGL